MTDLATGAAPAATDTAAIANVQTAETDPMARITQTMSEHYDKINPPRENGRFVAKEKTQDEKEPDGADTTGDTVIETKDQNPLETKVEPQAAAIDAPLSWSAEMKAKWSSLPSDAQTYIAQRESEAHKRISELGQQVKAFEPFQRIYEPLRQTAARNGVTPDQGLERLLAANEFLDRDPAAAIKWLAEAYGIDLSGGQPAQGDQQESGEVRALKAEIQSLKRAIGETASKVTARERSELEQAHATLASLVEEFAKDKTDFPEIESDILAHISAIRATEPGLKPDKILEKAYEAARWANPNTRAKLLATQEKARADKLAEEQRKKASEAKKVGSLNVKSAGASPARKGSWEETLRAVGERIAS